MVGWLVGWRVGWLARCFAGWLAGGRMAKADTLWQGDWGAGSEEEDEEEDPVDAEKTNQESLVWVGWLGSGLVALAGLLADWFAGLLVDCRMLILLCC